MRTNLKLNNKVQQSSVVVQKQGAIELKIAKVVELMELERQFKEAVSNPLNELKKEINEHLDELGYKSDDLNITYRRGPREYAFKSEADKLKLFKKHPHLFEVKLTKEGEQVLTTTDLELFEVKEKAPTFAYILRKPKEA